MWKYDKCADLPAPSGYHTPSDWCHPCVRKNHSGGAYLGERKAGVEM